MEIGYPKAKEYFRQAAALGSKKAAELWEYLDPSNHLALAESAIYKPYASEPDYASAKHWYRIAAALGSTVAAERLKELERLGY